MNLRSIQIRMTFWATLLVVVTSVGFMLQTYYSLQHSLYGELRTRMAQRIKDVQTQILPRAGIMPTQDLAYKIEDDYLTKDTSSFIRIRREGGNTLFLTRPPQDQSYDPATMPLLAYPDHIAEYYLGTHPKHHILLMGISTSVNGVNYIVEMGHPTDRIDNDLHDLTLSLIFGMPFILIVAIAGGLFWTRKALHPVEAMRHTAEQISSGNLRQRLPVSSTGDAIENLARTLNQMLGRLDRAYQQAVRFSADASHELRTPITILRGEMEALIRTEKMSDVSRDRLGSILEEIERLSSIVESLISLARLDAGENKEHKAVDLSHLVRTTVEQMQLLAEEKNILVTVEAPQPYFIMGESESLKQVIINLFDNAVKYTMNGGSIIVSTYVTDRNTVLKFKDNGMGIASDDIPHIFERFYRTDNARSQAIQGAGLGLSIVQSICQAHGGTIEVDSQQGGGTVFTITFPRTTHTPEA